jgi:hypothetical protein
MDIIGQPNPMVRRARRFFLMALTATLPVVVAASPPTITGTPATSVVAGHAYSFKPTAKGPAGSTLSFSIAHKPSWGSFSIATGELRGTPTTAEEGAYSDITISVSTGTASASLAAFSINVTQPKIEISTSQPFPRLGSYFIGGQPGSAYDSAWANYLAAMNVNVIGCYVDCGATMYGGSRQAFVAEVLALSPSTVNSQVFQYYDTDAGNPAATPLSFDGLQVGLGNLVAANPNWWAWADANAQTTHEFNTYFSPSWYQTNQTLAAGKNGDGLYWEEAAAQNQYQFYWTSTGGSDEANNLAGLYHDNFFTSSSVSYDYNFSGSSTATTDAAFGQSFRDGLTTGPAWIHANTSKLIIGNVAEWGVPGHAATTGYAGILNGGVFEGAFGETWSTMSWGGYADFQSQYSTIISNMAAPAYVILGHDNLSRTGTDSYQKTPYAAMRFGLTATLVNGNGYYFANSSYAVGGSEWFDEYAANSAGVCPTYNGTVASVAGRGYMGYPTSVWGSISGSGAAANINGLWARLFYNPTTGLTWVAINSPPGSGSITVRASSFGRNYFKMLTGTQDPDINNGATAPSITIPAGYDGRIAQLL